jgi:hypothetical protein
MVCKIMNRLANLSNNNYEGDASGTLITHSMACASESSPMELCDIVTVTSRGSQVHGCIAKNAQDSAATRDIFLIKTLLLGLMIHPMANSFLLNFQMETVRLPSQSSLLTFAYAKSDFISSTVSIFREPASLLYMCKSNK